MYQVIANVKELVLNYGRKNSFVLKIISITVIQKFRDQLNNTYYKSITNESIIF